MALHCLGGFVITALYGMPRPTADIDVLAVTQATPSLGWRPSPARHQRCTTKHGLYVDLVTVAECPDGHEGRLTPIEPTAWRNLRVSALDPYDLALAKLQRNLQRDRDDVLFLARTARLNLEVLRQRYVSGLPYLGKPEREDLTLDLWIEMIAEMRHAECPILMRRAARLYAS